MSETRLFFVTDSPEDNEEIFATLEEAKQWVKGMQKPEQARLRICIVRNAYIETGIDSENITWNYEDKSNTFETIKIMEAN